MTNDFSSTSLANQGIDTGPNLPKFDLTWIQNNWINVLIYIGILIGIFLLLKLAIHLLRKYVRKKRIAPENVRKVLLRVQVPKNVHKDDGQARTAQQIQETISLTENIFNAIGGLKAQKGFKRWWIGHDDEITFEMFVNKKIIYFYVAVPKYLQHYIEEQIHAQHPEALIVEADDYNIFNPKGFVVGTYLTYTKPYIFPIKTYKNIEGDPINSLANALGKFDEDSGAAIQFVVRSAEGGWHKWGAKTVSLLHQGKKLEDAMREAKGKSMIGSFFKEIGKATSSKSESPDPDKTHKMTSKEEEGAKGIEEKTSKSGLDVNIRLVVSGLNKDMAKLKLDDLVNSFNVFNIYEYGNSFKKVLPGKLNKLIDDFIYREFNEEAKMIMNVEELSSVFHFPFSFTDAPNIDWLLAKTAPLPVNIPTDGLLLGHNVYRGQKKEVYIKTEDRRRHMYVIGMTGTGKSFYIQSLAIQDILAGKGVCYIDPHGDGVDAILARIPKERADDVILFDPSDTERPMSLNLLEFESPEQKTLAVNELLAIFDKLYDLKATGGPMFEQYFRNAALLMMGDPESGNTILDLPRILADEDYRNYKLSKLKDLVTKNFWEKEAQKAGGEASLQNMVPYITSKLGVFIANDYMRPIISQQKSSFSFSEAINSKKIILVKLAKGQIGDMNANLLGMIVISKILMAVLGRATISEDERTDYYLYIDEFQNFLTDSIEVILSEARKYKLNLTIAHQYIGQLVKNNDSKFKDAIFGNVGTKVGFRIGVDDAELFAKEFQPVFNENDFLNCPKYTNFVKLLVDNANPPAFNMQTIHMDKFAKPNYEIAAALRELSRLKYGRDRAIIEEEIRQKQLNADV